MIYILGIILVILFVFNIPRVKKPYKVTCHYLIGGLYPSPDRVVGHFHWYWQANIVSWIFYYILGHGCNTWKETEK